MSDRENIREEIPNGLACWRLSGEQRGFVHALIMSSPLPMVVADSELIVQACNSAFERMFQYSSKECAGLNVDHLLGLAEPLLLSDETRQALRNGETCRAAACCRRKDGSTINAEVISVPVVHDEKFAGVCVTCDGPARRDRVEVDEKILRQQKQAEEAERSAEARNRALLDAIPDMIFHIRRDGTYLDYRPSNDLAPFVPPEQFLNRKLADVLPEPVALQALEAVERAIDTGEMQVIEYQLEEGITEPKDYEARIVKSGPDEVVAMVRDITTRKRAEEALRASENQLRENLAFQQRLIASLPAISLITTDLNAVVTSFSPGAEHIFGYKAEEMIGQPVAKLHLREDALKFPEIIREQLEGRVGFNGEITLVRKNGERFHAQFVTSPILDENGKAIALLGVSQDITERKRAEAEVQNRNRQLSVLNSVASAVNTSLNVKAILELLARELVDQMDFRLVLVSEYNESQQTARLLAVHPRDTLIGELANSLGLDIDNVVIPVRPVQEAENEAYARILLGQDWVGDDFALIAAPVIDPTLARMAQNLLGVKSIHWVPIVNQGRLAGTIVAGSSRLVTSEEERQLVLAAANQAAAAIEHARLYEEARREAIHNVSLVEVTKAITSTIPRSGIGELLDLIVEKVLQLTHSVHGSLFLLDESTDELSVRASHGLSSELIRSATLKRGEGIAGWVAETGRGLCVNDVENDDRFARRPYDERYAAIIAVPLLVKGKVLGVLSIDRLLGEPRFSEDEFRIVRNFADQAALAITNAQLFEETQKNNRRLEKLYELSLSLAGDTQNIFDRIVTMVAELFETPVVSIDEIDQDSLVVRSMFFHGEIVRGCVYPLAETPCDVVRREQRPQQYRNAMENFPNDRFLAENGLQGYLGVPVLNRSGQTVAILDVLDTRPRTFSEEDGSLLLTFCNRIYFQLEEERQQKQREKIQHALRESEAKYRGLFESVLEGVYQSTPGGRLLTVNPGLVSMLGYDSVEELLQVDISRDLYINPEDRKLLLRKLEEDGEIRNFELLLKRKTGQPVIALNNSRAIRDESGTVTAFEGTLTDITERRTLEDQLRQSQKMEAIGRLAGGVAHDFNNLMTAISGYSDLLLASMDPADPLRRDVEEIKKAGTRATALTSQLLAFSRKQVLQPRVLDLNAVVTEIQTMLRRLIGEDIELTTIADPHLGRVKADPGQIEQVILNLAVNARDAMPHGGKLTLETSNMEIDEKYASEHLDVQPGQYVMFAVADTGCGMPPEVQMRIFEPFFSTKEAGKGTGLGLATVYGIVSQSGGYIWVYSEPGKGSTFKVYLPRLTDAVLASEVRAPQSASPRGTETVLLVEDEGFLRDLARKVLEMNGYKVLQAASGAEAIEMCSSYGEPIHLLVTDVVMPRMSGGELAERLTQDMPALRVLYMSGYTDDSIVQHGILNEDMAFLQKPFTPTTLARKVREVLDAPFP